LIISGFLLVQMTKISMQSNLEEAMPRLSQDDVSDRVSDKFGAQDAVLILVQMDKDSNEQNAPKDIRDPEVVEFLIKLENRLSEEDSIDEIMSMGTIFKQIEIPEDLETSKIILKNARVDSLFNNDYTATLIYITCDLGTGEKGVKEINNAAQEAIKISGLPPGIKATVTGTPSMRDTILTLLEHDAIITLLLASAIIFILLIVTQKSFTKGIIVFLPLTLGIIWTLGTMAMFGIQLSIATVGIGAMILGLAVEYGVFMVQRYHEEREDKNQEDALKIAVSGVGFSILGSGLTTIVGFLALTISVAPMLGDLGFSLALGIGFCLGITIFITPSFIILEENLEKWLTEYNHKKHSKKLKKHKEKQW
ncbi:MAG: efflux RND transporter permease subunit, partial [Candidatus Pacearchaeota archaeon]